MVEGEAAAEVDKDVAEVEAVAGSGKKKAAGGSKKVQDEVGKLTGEVDSTINDVQGAVGDLQGELEGTLGDVDDQVNELTGKVKGVLGGGLGGGLLGKKNAAKVQTEAEGQLLSF